MQNKNFELSVLVNGKSVKEFGSKGRTYVEGKNGSTFTLKFKNNTADRVLARFSVDGLSVLDGKDADKDNSGYICQAFSSIEIDGWRTSLEETRKFEFSTKGKSFAGKTIGQANCGVVGVQVFAEKPPKVQIVEKHHWHKEYVPTPVPVPWDYDYPRPWRPYRRSPFYVGDMICTTATSGGSFQGESTYTLNAGSCLRSSSNNVRGMSCGIPTANFMSHVEPTSEVVADFAHSEVTDYNLGTKFGEAQKSSVKTVEFETGVLITQFELYYTDRAGLEKAGIDVDKKPAVAIHPKAFAQSFCTPPPED